MQLMALNALLLFDAIFIFFLFLVSVSCLLYYLPLVPPTRSSRLLLANMTAADIESALAQAGEGGGLPNDDTNCIGHDETGLEGCGRGGGESLLLDEEDHLRRECEGVKGSSSLYLHHHQQHHQHQTHLQQQSTVITTDPTTHILAPEHQNRAAKLQKKNDPPIECV